MDYENNWFYNFKDRLEPDFFNDVNADELIKLQDITDNFLINNEQDDIINFWVNYYNHRAFKSFDTLKDIYNEVTPIIDLYIDSIKEYCPEKTDDLANSLKKKLVDLRIDIQSQHIKYLFQTKFHLEFEYNQKLNRIKSLEEQNHETRAEYHALHELSMFISSTLNLNSVLDDTIDGLIGVLDIPYMAIFLFDEEQRLILKKFHNLDKSTANLSEEIQINILKGGIIQNFIDTKRSEPFKIDDVWQNEKIATELKKIYPSLRSAIIAPFIIADELLGIIIIGSNEPNALSTQIYDFIKVIVPNIAGAINNAKLYYKVNEEAIRDSLTGLYNRRHFQEQLNYHFEYAKRYSHPISVLMIDIDDFKKFNDNYGHNTGDFVLKNISRIILKNLRNTDIVARYGGEEIIVLLTETPKKWAYLIANRLVKSVHCEPFIISEDCPELHVTISVGCCNFPEDVNSALELVDMADKGMYIAKKSGKNQTGIFKD